MPDLPIGSIVIWPAQWFIGEEPPEWGDPPGTLWVAEWYLDAPIGPGDTIITLDATWGLFTPPTPPFVINTGGPWGFIRSYDEVMLVTSFNSPTSWNVTRGHYGTTPQTFNSVTFYADRTLETLPVGWEIRHEFDNCFIPCAGGIYAVNDTGGNNHYDLPIHTHGIGTISAKVTNSLHYHPVQYNLLSASTLSFYDAYGAAVNSVVPDWFHTHTATVTTSGSGIPEIEHTHTIPDAITNSVFDPVYGGANNTIPTYTYGAYFIQRIS